MSESNDYFDQLIRGEHADWHHRPVFNRIPQDKTTAVRDVLILLRHAHDEAQMAMATIRDIMRWHGGETIRNQLRPYERDLLPKVEALAGPEDCEPDDSRDHD